MLEQPDLFGNKYYERLNLANTKFDAYNTSNKKSPADSVGLQSHLYAMFIYSELDNPEYILEKRCLGYVELDLVGRALQHFEERCKEKEFRDAALRLVNSAGYKRGTKHVVKRIVNWRALIHN